VWKNRRWAAKKKKIFGGGGRVREKVKSRPSSGGGGDTRVLSFVVPERKDYSGTWKKGYQGENFSLERGIGNGKIKKVGAHDFKEAAVCVIR